jgi:nitrate/TMAO reductase-like tetraheme cytochrome c subunit
MAQANDKTGIVRRMWRALTSPSARWSVLALLLVGFAAGAVSVVSTQVMVSVTGSNEFCGGACHSMQWVAAEHKASTHGANRFGVGAACADCHIPHGYPEVLWYKAQAGLRDVYHEVRGTIATEALFTKKRKELAENVWAEFRANDSQRCRGCHVLTPEVLALQRGGARKAHEGRKAENKTCIDCHAGVAHSEPE